MSGTMEEEGATSAVAATATPDDDKAVLSVDTSAADEEHKVDNAEEKSDGLLRGWNSSEDAPPTSPGIDYSKVDETPYEHNFSPGDHIIRWDMLPILWPIQIHGIVLEVSEDKSEVTICDFGVTSVKSDEGVKKMAKGEQGEALVEEENEKFTEAIQDEDATDGEVSESTAPTDGEVSESTADASQTKKETTKKKKKRQRLNVIKLTKWSDLRKWHKVDYEGGLLNVGKGGIGKGLKNFGKKSEKLWSSMSASVTKSFAKSDSGPKDSKNMFRSVRYDVDEKGFCVHHPDVQLKKPKDDGGWAVVRKKCPHCIQMDCPAMMGDVSPKSETSVDSEPSFASTDDERAPQTKENASEDTQKEASESEANTVDDRGTDLTDEESSQSLNNGTTEPTSKSKQDAADEGVGDGTANSTPQDGLEPDKTEEEPKSLAKMIAEANEVDQRSRKSAVKVAPSSPQRSLEKKQSWSFMRSLSNIFPKKEEGDSTNDKDSANEGEPTKSSPEESKANAPDELPRSDPPVLVLARTRFILQNEDALPPYHIINANSECIAVWCKTGRWCTLQASVFLHSTAIGHAKSATALTLGVAATQPWLIPAFATVGIAAVGTPWLFLKVANDKWKEATMSLTEKFWMQAEPEVFVECIEKWSKSK